MRTVQLSNGRGKGLTTGDGYRFGKGMVAGLVVGSLWMAVPVVLIGLAFEIPERIEEYRREKAARQAQI